jgi:bacterial/archaeal transporter family-2 protein
MIYTLILIAVVIGALMPVQASINAELTRFVKHPYLGALISFSVGTMALSLCTLFQGIPLEEIKKLPSASPHLFIGGVLGALFVGSSIFLIPRMGATSMIAAFITGQLIMSVIIDHYGLLGLSSHPLNLTRIMGIFLLFVGLLLVIKKGS